MALAPRFAGLDAAVEVMEAAGISCNIGDTSSGHGPRIYAQPIDFAWLVRHARHRLAVRDEYGRTVGWCNERADCRCCAARYLCRRPLGHDGDHARTGEE